MVTLQKLYALLPGGIRRRLTPLTKRLVNRLNITYVGGEFLMDLDPMEWAQNQLRRGEAVEPQTAGLIQTLLSTGDAYIDVGAHVGYLTLVARQRVGPTGMVVAIEPQPYNCAKLLRNWNINKFENIVLFPSVAGEIEKNVKLHEQNESDRSRLSLNGQSLSEESGQVFYVPMRRLDSIIDEIALSHVKLIKVDTEGYELPTILGLGPGPIKLLA